MLAPVVTPDIRISFFAETRRKCLVRTLASISHSGSNQCALRGSSFPCCLWLDLDLDNLLRATAFELFAPSYVRTQRLPLTFAGRC